MEWDKNNPRPKQPHWAAVKYPDMNRIFVRRVFCKGCGIVGETAKNNGTPQRHPWENKYPIGPMCPKCKEKLDSTWGVEYAEWQKRRKPYIDAIQNKMGKKIPKTWWKDSLKNLFGNKK